MLVYCFAFSWFTKYVKDLVRGCRHDDRAMSITDRTTRPLQPLTGDYDLLFVYFSCEFFVCVS